jgi:alanine racemase
MTTTPEPAPPAPLTTVPADASAWVEIDAGAIADNVRELKRRSPSALLMAVVKADAYGHGAEVAARAALDGGADWLGVAQLTEAIALRDAGITAPLLSWIYPPGADLAGALTRGIDVGIGAREHVREVVLAARATGTTARVQLKVDTGLGRGGILEDLDDVLDDLAVALAEGALELTGTWSHFAFADAPEHPTVRAQQERFGEVLRLMGRRGIPTGMAHLANSAATLTNPSAHFDLVRPGLAVYGLSPVPDLGRPEDFGLREAMRVRARLTTVKRARAGQGVSYAHQYVTDRDTVLGVVPTGYADGIPRSAGSAGPVQVGDRRLTVAGRVCMDQFVLDLGPDFAGATGDVVTLVGVGAEGEPTAQDWAEAAGTINYEVVTRMGPRLPRVVLGGRH